RDRDPRRSRPDHHGPALGARAHQQADVPCLDAEPCGHRRGAGRVLPRVGRLPHELRAGGSRPWKDIRVYCARRCVPRNAEQHHTHRSVPVAHPDDGDRQDAARRRDRRRDEAPLPLPRPLMHRLFVVAIALAACVAPARAATSKGFHFAQIGTGFPEAVYVTSAPNDASTLYVVEQSGRIVIARGGAPAGTFLDIHSEVLDSGERGLVGFAFSPTYAQDHTFYVDYVATNGDTHVSRFTSDQGVALPSSEQQLLDVQQPFPNHKGGMLAFDKRGRLWVGLGDGGTDDNATYGDQAGRAQNMGVMLGKLLRLDTRQPGATWRIAALGLRNPYRFSFDRQTGDLWLVDVGTHLYEEIDLRTAAQLD